MFMLAILCLDKMADGLAPMVIRYLGSIHWYVLWLQLLDIRQIQPVTFGPRLAYTLLPIPNKGNCGWQYAWVPFIGPLIGAGLAVLFFQLVAP